MVSREEMTAILSMSVKSSINDFHSKHGHNFIGDYNYYVMLEEVYAAVSMEIPYNVGVLVSDK